MGCVAIIGRKEDSCCRLVRSKLEQRGREVLWLPEDRLFPCLDFAWNVWEAGATGVTGYIRYCFRCLAANSSRSMSCVPIQRVNGVSCVR
jgi:hypothetical protein